MTVHARPDRRVWPPQCEAVELVVHTPPGRPAWVEVLTAPLETMITLATIGGRGPLISVSHDVITIAGVLDYRVVSWDHILAAFRLRKMADRRHTRSTVSLDTLSALDQGSQTAEREELR